MMKSGKALAAIIFLFSMSCFTFAQTNPRMADKSFPKLPYVKKGACPFEGCMYGKWTLMEPAKLCEHQGLDSRVLADLKIGQTVEALTGEIHTTRYGEISVNKSRMLDTDKEKLILKPGDVLYDLEYLGEGFHRVWYKGKLYEIALGSDHLQDSDIPYGRIIAERRTNWWVNVRIKGPGKGLNGWIVDPKAKGMDRFGG
jgi:hypothetical protein